MRPPDITIGGPGARPLVHRWILFSSRKLTINLHKIMRDDDCPELHRHPWWNVSIVLKGSCVEHTEDGIDWYCAPALICRRAASKHRIMGIHAPVWTLFIHGEQNA